MLPGSLGFPFTHFCSKPGCPEAFLRLSAEFPSTFASELSHFPEARSHAPRLLQRSETPAREVPWRSVAFSSGVCISLPNSGLSGLLAPRLLMADLCRARVGGGQGWGRGPGWGWAGTGWFCSLRPFCTPFSWPCLTFPHSALSLSPSSLPVEIQRTLWFRGDSGAAHFLTSSTHHRGFLNRFLAQHPGRFPPLGWGIAM